MSSIIYSRSHSSLSKPPIQFSFVPPKLPVESEQYGHLLIEYVSSMCMAFNIQAMTYITTLDGYHRMDNLDMQREFLTIDADRQRQTTYLTSELLKATHRFNLRGAIEFIRERIKSQSSSSSSTSHSSPTAASVIDEPMQMLLNDHEFYHELSQAVLSNQIVFNDIQRSMVGLYHSLSKYFHSQQTCENIVIDARLLAPFEQFVIGVLFKRFNIPSIYIDKDGNMAMFPYNLKDISSSQ
ncbi:unnamed protein product [Rotaria sordida]|uniref:Uncharacterized protein n=1 Tax=Rotaria sordida TaxID=392033 RepID=A0A814SMU8_9BILA|nr:unnamed protein product [Rotaria sordida]